jgi:hypothetical protein
MNFKECNDEEVKKIKNWCGPNSIKYINWITKFIPQLFPCACRKHDMDWGQKQTMLTAIKKNDNFYLYMFYSSNRKKWYLVPLYHIASIVFYFVTSCFIPVYDYFVWRKMEE